MPSLVFQFMKLENTFFHSLKETVHLDSHASRLYWESLFVLILKADLDNIKFPRGSTLLQYVDELLLCSPHQASAEPHTKVTDVELYTKVTGKKYLKLNRAP